jgi:hypothetical protein
MIIERFSSVNTNRAGGRSMLLTDLRTKIEQEAFLRLAYLVAKADGSLDYAETILIGMYREEMGLESAPSLSPQLSVNDLCHIFTDAHSKNIVFLNLFSLAQADGYNNLAQKCVMETIRQELTVSIADAKRLEGEINILTAPYFPNYID